MEWVKSLISGCKSHLEVSTDADDDACCHWVQVLWQVHGAVDARRHLNSSPVRFDRVAGVNQAHVERFTGPTVPGKVTDLRGDARDSANIQATSLANSNEYTHHPCNLSASGFAHGLVAVKTSGTLTTCSCMTLVLACNRRPSHLMSGQMVCRENVAIFKPLCLPWFDRGFGVQIDVNPAKAHFAKWHVPQSQEQFAAGVQSRVRVQLQHTLAFYTIRSVTIEFAHPLDHSLHHTCKAPASSCPAGNCLHTARHHDHRTLWCVYITA
jgi:hypothetical protein